MNRIHLSKFIPGVAWFFVVLVLICMPGKDIPETSWLDTIYFDKWVHTGVFGLMALLFMLPIGRSAFDSKEKMDYYIRIAIATSIWGLATEFIQKYWVSGRNFDLYDWGADSIGAFIAYFICIKGIFFKKPGSN